MSELKGLVFDIDNTAVPDGAMTVDSEWLKTTIAEASNLMPCIAATGRTAEFTLPIVRQLNLRYQCVIANGAGLIDPLTGDVTNVQLLDKLQSEQIIEICGDLDNLVCFAGDTQDMVKPARQKTPAESMGVYIFGLSALEAQSLQVKLADNTEDTYVYISQGWSKDGMEEYDVNISHRGARKELATAVALGNYGLHLSDVIFVGDGLNDQELMVAAGLGVAVANAHPDILAIAQEIVEDCSADGLAQAIERFVLS